MLLHDDVEKMRLEGIDFKILDECDSMDGEVMALHKKGTDVYTVWLLQYGDTLFKILDSEKDCIEFFNTVCEKLDDDELYKLFL